MICEICQRKEFGECPPDCLTKTRVNYGEGMAHRSGWTASTTAEAMEKIGFQIYHEGIGQTHGMGRRDFRVAGRKE